MTVRNYSSLILFETLFDSIPEGNPDLDNFSLATFSPNVEIIEEDCGTALGEVIDVNYDLQGKIELATGLPFSQDRIEQLLSKGVYSTSVRNLSTCTSRGGVCMACYASARPYETPPPVGHLTHIHPEYAVGTDVFPAQVGDTVFSPSLTTDMYDTAYVYHQGALLDPSAYSLGDTALTLNSPLTADGQVLIRFTTITRTPFLYWLADTYAGSLLGLKALPHPNLPIKKRLLASLIPDGVLESLIQQLSDLKAVPPESSGYIEKIRDPVEKALFVIALFSIYLNVN
jgi:hypothetical protein